MDTARNLNLAHGLIRTVVAEAASGGTGISPNSPEMEWSVGKVAARVHVPASTLRTWERRYGIGPSGRSDGGHRRYTELDVARVRVMTQLVASGVPVQSAARVALAADERRLRDDAVTALRRIMSSPAENS